MGITLLVVVLLLCVFIGFLSVTEYKPSGTETLNVEAAADGTLKQGDTIKIFSWNIGYGALGDNADFFMDGGTMVKSADEKRLNENLEAIENTLNEHKPDIVFLQETDRNSQRSSHVDEFNRIKTSLNGLGSYDAVFANNFKAAFVPYPVPPIGKVDSGIASYSRFPISSAERVQLPVPFSWPMSMANLKRCLLVSRVKLQGSEKELVLVNLHLEAYDDGEGKLAQTNQLSELLSAEAAKGNYVIAGGDFNQIFSCADGSAFPLYNGNWEAPEIDVSMFGGGWQFLMDEDTPSCRLLNKPYYDADKDDFQYYIIDGFIVSDNIQVNGFEALDLGFTASDHNPLELNVTLK